MISGVLGFIKERVQYFEGRKKEVKARSGNWVWSQVYQLGQSNNSKK